MRTIYFRFINDECMLDAYLQNWEKVTYEKYVSQTLIPETINNISSVYDYMENYSQNLRRSPVIGDLLCWNHIWHRIEPIGFSSVTPIYNEVQIGDNTRLIFIGLDSNNT